MKRDVSHTVVVSGGFGCLLFLCFLFNFFFGLIFFSFLHWLMIEALLLILLLLQGAMATRKIFSNFRQKAHNDKVIDVEATVVDEKKKLS